MALTVSMLHTTDQALGRQQLDEREDLWEKTMREHLCPMGIRLSRGDRGAGGVQSADLADVVLTDWDCPPMDGYVRRSSSARVSDQDVIYVMAGCGGEERLSVSGNDSMLGRGALLVMSGGASGRAGFSVPHRSRKRTLILPRPALVAAGSGLNIPRSLTLGPDRPVVNIFHTFLDQVWTALPGLTATEREAARTALIVLIAGMVRSDGVGVNEQSALPALRARLDRSIANRLQGGPVRLEDLAAELGVSTRTIYRAFALTGDTMKSVVRAQRLAAVRRDLLDTNLPIGRIAHRWSYYDASHLGREFREVFGLSAGEYRQNHAGDKGGAVRSAIDQSVLTASTVGEAS